MQRTRVALLSLGVVLGLLMGAAGATSNTSSDSDRRGKIVRWDLAQIVDGIALPGGTDVSASDGETIALTGSGHAEPRRHKAYGGGTFVHTLADGSELAGSYYVTGFKSWERLKGGSIVGLLTDGIGPIHRATSGILKLRIQLVAAGGSPQFNGVLTIFCHLPGTVRDAPEGVALRVPALGLDFNRQVSGVTIFHILHPRSFGGDD